MILPSHISQNQRNDVFVGNLAFGTTEDQLYQAFSDLGRIIKVRMVTDETGKPRGFAFIEFEDPSSALSAIRNMNDYEINGRRIRVNFSNSSHLESLAGKLGMDLSASQPPSSTSAVSSVGAAAMMGMRPVESAGTHSVADALKGLSKAESYDIIQQLKAIADRDPEEARKIISAHPQLPEAILFLMSRLDMIQTPVTTNMMDLNSVAPPGLQKLPMNPLVPPVPSSLTSMMPPMPAVPPSMATTPGVSLVGTAARPVDPRARLDPRAGAATTGAAAPRVDPRMAAARPPPTTTNTMMAPPPVPMPMGQTMVGGVPPVFNPYMMPPPLPNTMIPTQAPAVANPTTSWMTAAQVLGLDMSLVQQVMALSPQQIGQLPPDKQQSILALRQQITNAMSQQQQTFK